MSSSSVGQTRSSEVAVPVPSAAVAVTDPLQPTPLPAPPLESIPQPPPPTQKSSSPLPPPVNHASKMPFPTAGTVALASTAAHTIPLASVPTAARETPDTKTDSRLDPTTRAIAPSIPNDKISETQKPSAETGPPPIKSESQDDRASGDSQILTDPNAKRPTTPLHKDSSTSTAKPSHITPVKAENQSQSQPQLKSQPQESQSTSNISKPDTTLVTTTTIGMPNFSMQDMKWSSNGEPTTPINSFNRGGLNLARIMDLMQSQPVLSSPQQHTTVTPSQVTLPFFQDDKVVENPAFEPAPDGQDTRLESFARLVFQDSVFQITTYEVVIGRDQRALRQARLDQKRIDAHRRQTEENTSRGLPPPPPPDNERKFSKSYVSEEGGMLGPESESDFDDAHPAKRRKMSTGEPSRMDEDDGEDNIISDKQYVTHTPGAAAVDLSSLRPCPDNSAFVGIHSPGPNIAIKTKAISRRHLKLAYNKKKGVFEATPLHKNGFFCEEKFIKEKTVVLRSGDRMQIKDVDFTFFINGVEIGKTGAEEYDKEAGLVKKHSQGGKEMSFDFEQSHGNGQMNDTSDELSELDGDLSPPPDSDSDADVDAEVDADEEDEDVDMQGDVDDNDGLDMENDFGTPEAGITGSEQAGTPQDVTMLDADNMLPQLPKKRGPGRPPKNGIMSKREQRLIKKQQAELAKKTLPQIPLVEPPIKRKVGRPRKHPLPDGGSDQPEKRKYKPRKPKNEDGEEISEGEKKIKEKKDKKVRPKSPPLELNIEDYTEEQLQKPPKNYSVLIDEALEDFPEGLTLKQIYKRISMKYPHFYFNVETKGWESSVRHNLIGNKAFYKDEERVVWMRVPGVDLDASKKNRKGNSPDPTTNQAYGAYSYPYNSQHMAPGVPGYPPGQIPPGFQMPSYNSQHQGQQHQGQPGQPGQQHYGTAATSAGKPTQAMASQQQQSTASHPGYNGPLPAPAQPQVGVAQPSTYSSPYSSRPPPIATSTPAAKTVAVGSAAGPATQPTPTTLLNTSYSVPGANLAPGVPSVPQHLQQQHAPRHPSLQHPVQPNTSQQHHPQQSIPPHQISQHRLPQQQQQQQIPHQHPQAIPQQARLSTTEAAPPLKPIIDPRLLQAVVSLKNGLINNLQKASNPHAEVIVYSALNRCAGLKQEATTAENENMERICMKGIRQVIEAFRNKHRSPTPGGGSAPPNDTALLDSGVIRALLGFKDASCKALKAGVGDEKAEAVTLSAIDRVLGLADSSLIKENENLKKLELKLMETAQTLLNNFSQHRAQATGVAR